MPACPACGKDVQVYANGKTRPHAVPIEQRSAHVHEPCEGGWLA